MMHLERSDDPYPRKRAVKRIRTQISDDGYEAYVVVDDENAQLSEVQAALESDRVVYGIESKAVLEALENPGKKILVASGCRHTDGKDGWFERTECRPQTEPEKKFGITNINVGEQVGIIHKETQGSVGVDVFGRKVLPKQGKPISFISGPNLKRTETDDLISIEAAIDGNLKITSANIEIVAEHVIHQDIDYSCGEIEYAGSLRIVGDLKGNSSLKVKHDLLVTGSVEDAKIICGGNVTIKGSFVGRGDGLIRAKGDVEVHVVLNQTVEAGGSITITKESVNAHLIASDSVIGPRAVIMGGVVAAGNKIEVNTLGGELYSTTRVRLGTQSLASEDAVAIDKEIELQKKVCDELKNEIYLLVRDRIDGNNFTPEKSERLKMSQNKLREFDDVIKSLLARKQDASAETSRKKSPKVIVSRTIHQSVLLEINGVRHGLRQSFENVTFEESKNEIVRTKNI